MTKQKDYDRSLQMTGVAILIALATWLITALVVCFLI